VLYKVMLSYVSLLEFVVGESHDGPWVVQGSDRQSQYESFLPFERPCCVEEVM